MICLFALLLSITYVTAIENIFDSLSGLSPTLYQQISNLSSAELHDILSFSSNITLLLPNNSTINAYITSSQLNSTQLPTNFSNSLLFLVLNGTYSTEAFLNSPRRSYSTLLENESISIGPSLDSNYNPSNNGIELFSSVVKSTIKTPDIYCTNGVIHVIDQFLQPPKTPLETISYLPETEYEEGLLKSLNMSDTVSGKNKTIFAPNNEAWTAVNGSALPFGTFVHNLKYLVVDGVYTLDQLINNTFFSDYQHYEIWVDQKSRLNGLATIVKPNILTTHGVIHIIDQVLPPNSNSTIIRNDNNSSATKDPAFGKSSGRKSSMACSILVKWNVVVYCLLLLPPAIPSIVYPS